MLPISELKHRVRRAARTLLKGTEIRQYEDELISTTLHPLVPRPETGPQGAGPRLNILTPTVSSLEAFGGVSTLLELPMRVFRHSLQDAGWRLRIICLGAPPEEAQNLVLKFRDRLAIDPARIEFYYRSAPAPGKPTPPDNPVAVGPGDVFLASLWQHFFLALPLMEFQKAQAGGRATPYVSMIQDYEAYFNPWSSAFMLANAAYNADWPMVHIFNSIELKNYYMAQGHRVLDHCAFEPVMNPTLRKALAEGPVQPKQKRLIFYGRPTTRRNCYYLTRLSLEAWSEMFPNSRDWEVISAGRSHRPFMLRNGRQIEVLGKVSLEEYVDQLRRAAVGLSLMASPHPSYPPLEMAHFGAMTVTNAFAFKDLSNWHENIVSVGNADPERLARALTQACQRFEQDPARGLAAKSLKPQYLRDYDEATLTKLAALISGCLAR